MLNGRFGASPVRFVPLSLHPVAAHAMLLWAAELRAGLMEFDFWIPGYMPRWTVGHKYLIAEEAERLASLVGRPLTRTALMWDAEADEWWAGGPVVLAFDEPQLEITHQKFDELSITWDAIDLTQPLSSEGVQLTWRYDRPDQLRTLADEVLRSVQILSWVGPAQQRGKRRRGDDLAEGSVAIGFTFGAGQVVVHNALDENGLEWSLDDYEVLWSAGG